MTKPSEPTGWRSIELYNKITLGVALPAFGKAAWKPFLVVSLILIICKQPPYSDMGITLILGALIFYVIPGYLRFVRDAAGSPDFRRNPKAALEEANKVASKILLLKELESGQFKAEGWKEGDREAFLMSDREVVRDAELIRDPNHPTDPFAIACVWRGKTIGYLPPFVSRFLGPTMDKGLRLKASIHGWRSREKPGLADVVVLPKPVDWKDQSKLDLVFADIRGAYYESGLSAKAFRESFKRTGLETPP
ncbi:unknown [Sutterella sp. CAG:351]|uniref:HIRAN domain-containing protein n=1 Tax=Dakarella massiliensis TaxID=1506471 RepID=UPI00033CF7B5|nr:HIRAN domain-containing protein [Dakarella massiliensis]CDE52259.1 unknown [Sutterella sp. CAG:351]